MTLNFPEKAYIGSTIFKKAFIENSDLTPADKKFFNDKVERITWEYSLKPENCFIKGYKDDIREYYEVEVIIVKIKEDTHIQRLAEIIMRKIPYPMVLVIQNNEKVQLWTAHQRTNKADISKNVLEELIETPWIDETTAIHILDYEQLGKLNMFQFYTALVDIISIFRLTGEIKKETLTGEVARSEFRRRKEIDEKIEILRNEIKHETQFSRKIELNIQIKQLEQERDK